MANRARRGNGAAALFAQRQTEDIGIDEDEDTIAAPGAPEPDEDEEDDGLLITHEDEPEGIEQAPDYSHEGQDEPEEEAADEDGVDVLKRQLDELRGENQSLRQQAAGGEIAALEADQANISHALTAAKNAMAAAKGELEDAGKAGDWKKVSDAQEKIAIIGADIRSFQDAGEEIKQTIEAKRKAPQRQQPAPAGDPTERVIASFDAKLQPWIRKNKADLFSDPIRGKEAELAHAKALKAGLKEFSPEYFASLDEQMGYAEVKPKTKTNGRRPAGKPHVAAPGGSRAAPARSGPITEVTLSRAELDMARSFNMSPKEYAKNKAEIIKNGQDPSRSGLRYSQQTHHSKR